MVNYRQFAYTDDAAYNIFKALEYCKENGEDTLVFDPGIYRVKRDMAGEAFFSVSNHSDPGLKRICFLLQEMENFTVDGGGSEFIFEDILTPAAVDRCRNVTIRNFSFTSLNTQNAQCEVVRSGADWAEMRVTAGCPCFVLENELYAGDRDGEHQKLRWFIESDARTGMLAENAADYFFFKPELRIVFSETADGLIRMDGLQRFLPVGNTLVFASRTRKSCGILLNESKDTTIENVTFYSGIGMGVLAQNCDGVHIERMATRLRDNRRYSINADAAHFVHCKGKIHIKDSFFEGQLDDALNVHSIYLKIVGKLEDTLLVKYGHWEAVGIAILRPGAVVRTVDPETQLPSGEYTVRSVKTVNLDVLEVKLNEDISAVKAGELLDEVSWQPEVLFENCTVQNNRARGMLLASAGKTVIRGNTFRSPGASVQFESSGQFWFESGGVEDVLITENVFENCKYTPYCRAIIEAIPRPKTEEGRYFHGSIRVVSNVFRDCHAMTVLMSNAAEFVFRGNTFENSGEPQIRTEHCQKTDIQL